MKQSLKAKKTIFNEPCSFSDFIKTNTINVRMIAHCNSVFNRKSISDACPRNENYVILIGPEGDFTAEEINQALARDYIPVHLGTSRLRTETAGIAACHSVYFINQ
jgi:16S rRNA (uracil1498-N3)-methyltransferase